MISTRIATRLLAALAVSTALAAASPAAAQSRIELTDDIVASQGGNDILLEQNMNAVLFGDGIIRRELMRAGLERGCLLLDGARDRSVAGHRAAFRPHLIASMRAVVPPEEMATSTGLIAGDLGRYRRRVTAEIRRTASAIYDRSAADARGAALAELSAAPAVAAGAAAGRFADWRLDSPYALEMACNIIASSKTPDSFAQRKRIFDGLLRRQGE